ncbi:MAG TPA: hypothetical protein VLU46_10470 [Thermoanaerobaculia bacterium]|nr:hypothetical protein [Thermoanaerobaculia bacterium]
MQTTDVSAEAARDRQLYRKIDVYASTEAAAALHAAASGMRQGIAAVVLTSADAIVRGHVDDTTNEALRQAIVSPEFPGLVRAWMRELREVASAWPDSGACTVATALKLWSWTLDHFRRTDPNAVDELADAVCPLIAARCFVLDAITEKSALRSDLSHVYAAHVSALAGAACAELVFGYRKHLVWDAEGCAACFVSEDLDDLEAVMPGITAGAGTTVDVINADGTHPAKRGPCVRFDGLDAFMRLRNRLDGCLTGARFAKDRAAATLARPSQGRA